MFWDSNHEAANLAAKGKVTIVWISHFRHFSFRSLVECKLIPKHIGMGGGGGGGGGGEKEKDLNKLGWEKYGTTQEAAE